MAARSGWLLGGGALRIAWLRGGDLRRLAASGYAKKAAFKGKGKIGVKEALRGPEVCKDPVILTTHAVGVNIYKQGNDPKLLPDTEYPECWPWEVKLTSDDHAGTNGTLT
ncbi:large ribosomal subunit protein mL54 isoform X2 [Narcine bancroftii]|uniref:large ribosomal subunit protein mL54 isoform X2 n=1 Tax=Narcine bancroftii TaxID=1343680 RepID=UPI0038318874